MTAKHGRLIGLTGGIATGKSTAARFFVEAGAQLVDADQLARQVVALGTPGLAAVREAFGPEVLRPDGTLDRDALGGKIFGSAEARQRLNAIVHPLVAEAGRAAVEAAWARDPEAVVVYDVPLLYETGTEGRFNVVVVVYVPRAEQLRRLMARDGLTAAAAQARISSQMDIEEKARRAQYVLVNTGTVEDLRAAVHKLVRLLREDPGETAGEVRG